MAKNVNFRSRGIGLDSCSCFVCGTKDRDGKGHIMLNNIAGFVDSKEDGEAIVAMFSQGAHLDYRESEPNWIQVKVGACDKHLANLQHLNQLCSDGTISKQTVQQAIF